MSAVEDPSERALELGGFVLAHAVWSVSDGAPDDLLCPLTVVVDELGRTLSRFEARTQELAIRKGKEAMSAAMTRAAACAFACEGLFREAAG